MDDKTFPYLVVTQREDYPRVFVTRNPTGVNPKTGEQAPEMKGAKIFGPFTNAGDLREAVQILQRVFKFRTCKLDIVEGEWDAVCAARDLKSGLDSERAKTSST